MIPAVTQTLAEILSDGTSSITKDQIFFNHPKVEQEMAVGVNLYCYDVRESYPCLPTGLPGEEKSVQDVEAKQTKPLKWFDISFLVSAWDFTALGEQHLLSEVLMLLSRYSFLPLEYLSPVLQGYGRLPMRVSTGRLGDPIELWHALGAPLRPALHVIVTIPFLISDRASTNPNPSRNHWCESTPIK
ncbi:DUF4255 domain-containing protein [Acaryochloris sp. CCMEE 5410]|uniref:DUF4255 domain-containing protein n=1 Tax=Acaryochloris sp. CCMEE 5410 TaxID=310037 RepID=UPI0021CF3A53|nr:DUF4255 domain-containing protein [Acaryochloris sp. CCMEE 5410]KAI9130409.1 DUF4255 domain-containing protein [Acaryochloris sp. CCMEE 5410]